MSWKASSRLGWWMVKWKVFASAGSLSEGDGFSLGCSKRYCLTGCYSNTEEGRWPASRSNSSQVLWCLIKNITRNWMAADETRNAQDVLMMQSVWQMCKFSVRIMLVKSSSRENETVFQREGLLELFIQARVLLKYSRKAKLWRLLESRFKEPG